MKPSTAQLCMKVYAVAVCLTVPIALAVWWKETTKEKEKSL